MSQEVWGHELGAAGEAWVDSAMMATRAPTLKVTYPSGRARKLPLYDSSKPRVRTSAVYMVKTLPDGIRLAYNRDYKLLGSVRATPGEWDQR